MIMVEAAGIEPASVCSVMSGEQKAGRSAPRVRLPRRWPQPPPRHDEYFHTSLGGVALLFLPACAVTPVLAVLAHRYRPRLTVGLARILVPAS